MAVYRMFAFLCVLSRFAWNGSINPHRRSRHDESLIFPQPSYDERIHLYPEKFRKGFIRFSVGLEEPNEVIRDLALKTIGL